MAATFEYSVLVGGNSDFIRNAVIPFLDAVEEALECESSREGPLGLVGFPEEPRVQAAVTDFLLGVVFTWAVGTVLDEVYKLKFQPALRKWLEAADQVIIWPKRMPPSFVSAVNHADLGVIVAIVMTAATPKGLGILSEQAVELHCRGREWAMDNPQALPVQLWELEEHGVAGPMEFQTLAEALGGTPNKRIELAAKR